MDDGATFCPSCGASVNGGVAAIAQKSDTSCEGCGNVWEGFVRVLKNPFIGNFCKGRAQRMEYWGAYLFFSIIGVILDAIKIMPIQIPYLIVSLIISISSIARRLHDTGHSGWCFLIPIYGFVLLFFDSEPGINQYGKNPKGIGNTESDSPYVEHGNDGSIVSSSASATGGTWTCKYCGAKNPLGTIKCEQCGKE